MKQALWGIVLGAIIITGLLGGYYLVWGRDTSLSVLQQSGVIRVGYSIEAPYAFLNAQNQVSGESPEVARVIAARLGIDRVEWRQVEFDELIPELRAGHIDVIAAGMFITPERAKEVSFSEPTFHVREGLLVAKGNPYQIHSYLQILQRPGVKVAVLSGSIEEKLLARLGIPEEQRVVVPDALTGRVAVETGLVDGLALSSLTIQWMALQGLSGRVEAAEPFESSKIWATERLGYGGFAFRSSDTQLLRAWNRAMQDYIGTDEHLRLIQRFGFSARELPGSMHTQEIITP